MKINNKGVKYFFKIVHRFIVIKFKLILRCLFVLDSYGLHSKKLNIFYGELNDFKHFVHCMILFSFESSFSLRV